MSIVIDANMKLFADRMNITSSRMISEYGLKTVDEIIEAEAASPEAYVIENGRFPIIDTAENDDGDTVIITGDGKGYIIRYTFTE